jgi:hypothetical protein
VLSCPFEAVIDGSFERCCTVPLSGVLAEIVPNGLSDVEDVARTRNEITQAIEWLMDRDYPPFE